MTNNADHLPLSGLRVLELSHAVMGPTTGMILADMGAEVIKIERAPRGDDTRRLKGFGAGFFPYFNRNKKSIALDLKSDEGKGILKKLVASADIFLENFGPGTVGRLGFGYAECADLNPRLIYCSLKGFMPGPYEKRPALDEVVQMMAGLAYMTGPTGRPLRAGASVTDILGGTFGVVGILTALYERERTGRGRLVMATLFEAVVMLIGQHMTYSAVTGRPAPPMPERVSAWSVYDLFESKDKELVFIGLTSDQQWERFCDTFGLIDLKTDERLKSNNSRIDERSWLIPRLKETMSRLSRADIMALAEKAGVPFAQVSKPEDMFTDPQLNEGGGLVETTLPGNIKTRLPKLPIRIGDYDFGLRNDPPDVGRGGAEVLRSLGLTDDDIDRLRRDGNIVADD
jgi:crotonobetainyl-CoA:carnitine CoA-transferase CaiB-like acyl-CoA transferase